MNIDFNEMVAALAKDGDDILQSLNAEKCHLLHMAVGISGEASELLDAQLHDIDNITEELGDIEFYLRGLEQGLGLNAPTAVTAMNIDRKNLARRKLQVVAGDILDLVKKHVIYNKELPLEELKEMITNLHATLAGCYIIYGVTRDQVIAANIEKLSKRYQGLTYSDQAAQERADKQS